MYKNGFCPNIVVKFQSELRVVTCGLTWNSFTDFHCKHEKTAHHISHLGNVTTFYHLPYSPDLSPPDYFLFPKLKMKLKGLHFAVVVKIPEAISDELNKAQKEEFSAAFQKECDRTKVCIYASGAYFDSKKRHVSTI
jgi:hypothetical protein